LLLRYCNIYNYYTKYYFNLSYSNNYFKIFTLIFPQNLDGISTLKRMKKGGPRKRLLDEETITDLRCTLTFKHGERFAPLIRRDILLDLRYQMICLEYSRARV